MTTDAALTSPEAMATTPIPDYGKALIAGLVGGLAGTIVKTLCERISAPRPMGADSPLATGIRNVSSSLVGHEPDEATVHLAESVVHWIFGIATGAGYAVLAEKWPKAAAGRGAAFRVFFWVGAHELILPLIGWSPSPARMTAWEQGNELVSHAIYGVAVEVTRRFVRART